MECEICGEKAKRIFVVEIEGVRVRACEKCSKSGNILTIIEEKNEERKEKKLYREMTDEYLLVENYGKIISEARKKAGLSIREIAEKIGEKESLVKKIEKEEIRPSEEVVDKLERILKVNLRERIKEGRESKKKETGKKLRIADVVVIRD
jgi:putative transcription factor